MKFTCPSGHTFDSRVLAIVNRANKCLLCAGLQVVDGITSLADTHPYLTAEWDTESNDVSPRSVSELDAVRRHWLCPEGHRYQLPTKTRVRGSGCPYCSGRLVLAGLSDLPTVRPDLAQEWDDPVPATGIGVASKYSARWRCPEGHRWTATVSDRALGGTGCPRCAGKLPVVGVNDLATTHPEIADQWHERNAPLRPQDVKSSSGRSVWWRVGSCGHEWRTQVRYRKGPHCSVCAGAEATPGVNDAATVAPDVVPFYDIDRNTAPLTQFRPGSGALCYWRCSLGHHWRESVPQRCGA